MIKKVRGIQTVARNFDYVMKGKTREATYTKSFQEMTIDTDKGSFVITKDDLLKVARAKEAA